MNIPTMPRWQSAISSFKLAKNPLPLIDAMVREKGSTFQIYLGGLYKMILTADPDFVQHILQKNHRIYGKSEVHFDRISHFLGRGLLTSEGQYWLQQRRLIQPGFHKARLESILQLMEEVCEEYLRGLDQQLDQQPIVDINQKMMEIAFSIIARSVFSQSLPPEDLKKMSDSITQLQLFIIKIIRQPYYRPLFTINGEMKRHEAIRDQLNQIVLKYIEERRSSDGSFDDLLQMLLDARYEDTGKGMTTEQLIDETNILFLAGHETSANALAWTWYLLSQHPKVVEQIRGEVASVLRTGPLDFQKIQELVYTGQVINESMRLYPPVWTTNRVVTEDDEFKGNFIKKGTVFATYFYGMHRSENIWEAPETFNPDRFEKSKASQRHPYAFVPFGAGSRICIGNQFAMMEMKLILAKMIHRYEVTLVEGQDIYPQPLLSLRPAHNIRLRMNRRYS